MNIFNKVLGSIKKKEFLSAFVFLVLGLVFIVLAMQHPIWTSSGPSEGFFPLVIGLLIVGSSSAIMAPVVRILVRQEEEQKIVNTEHQGSTDISKVFCYGIFMVLYAISFETIGFLISTTLFFILVLKFAERRSWKSSVFYALLMTITSYFLFAYLLKVNLSRGLLEWM